MSEFDKAKRKKIKSLNQQLKYYLRINDETQANNVVKALDQEYHLLRQKGVIISVASRDVIKDTMDLVIEAKSLVKQYNREIEWILTSCYFLLVAPLFADEYKDTNKIKKRLTLSLQCYHAIDKTNIKARQLIESSLAHMKRVYLAYRQATKTAWEAAKDDTIKFESYADSLELIIERFAILGDHNSAANFSHELATIAIEHKSSLSSQNLKRRLKLSKMAVNAAKDAYCEYTRNDLNHRLILMSAYEVRASELKASGEYQKAKEYYNNAIKLFDTTGSLPKEQDGLQRIYVFALTGLAKVLLREMTSAEGRIIPDVAAHEKIVELLKQACEITTQYHVDPKDHATHLLISALFGLGFSHESQLSSVDGLPLDEIEKIRIFYEDKVFSVVDRHGDDRLKAKLYKRLAHFYKNFKTQLKCDEKDPASYYLCAIKLMQEPILAQNKLRRPPEFIRNDMKNASMFFNKGRYEDSFAACDRAYNNLIKLKNCKPPISDIFEPYTGEKRKPADDGLAPSKRGRSWAR